MNSDQGMTMRLSDRIARHRVRGVSLIEVLVTIVVMSIGLLGLAGLQATGTKVNHSAYMRSQAVALAYDMADRMRANSSANYSTNFVDTYVAANGPACNAALGAVTAARDANQWKSCLEDALPVGRGRVNTLPAAPGAAYVDSCGQAYARTGETVWIVEVSWDNSRLQNEAAVECVVVKTEVAPL